MTQDEFFSTLRSGAIFIGGAATVMGVNSLSAVDLQTDLDHMINGAKEFMLGAGPLIGVGMALWGKFKASPAAQILHGLPSRRHLEHPQRQAADCRQPDDPARKDQQHGYRF